MKEDSFTLDAQQIRFFDYFITSYLKNVSIGRMEESHHDAVAITLQLASLLNIEIKDEQI